jgi:5-methylcytosine-specific restriction endonuclease McrA
MKNHTKVYLKGMGYSTTDFIPCEVCGGVGQDIHHIESRGMGGSKIADTIENLMALCRPCHHEADFGTKLKKDYLYEVHNHHLAKRVI